MTLLSSSLFLPSQSQLSYLVKPLYAINVSASYHFSRLLLMTDLHAAGEVKLHDG